MRPKSGDRLPWHARSSPRATIGPYSGGVVSPSNPQHGRPLASQSAGDVPDHVIAPTITSAADDVAEHVKRLAGCGFESCSCSSVFDNGVPTAVFMYCSRLLPGSGAMLGFVL